jgi:hypothetical protein
MGPCRFGASPEKSFTMINFLTVIQSVYSLKMTTQTEYLEEIITVLPCNNLVKIKLARKIGII